MQEIIVERPYQFVPPHRGDWVPSFIQRFRLVDHYLNYFEGVTSYEVRSVEFLKDSLKSGHGIILAPNHCRYADPLAMGWIARHAKCLVYAMASWHLFNQGWLQAFAMRMCGGFSVNREGSDRTSIDTAVDVVANATRPLVIFPEGTVFRTNDRLSPLLNGVSFLARSAARKRMKADQGKVVIHPIAVKYLFKGDLHATIEPVLTAMEKRLSWGEKHSKPDLLTRLERIAESLLSLKEIQYFGRSQAGSLRDRKQGLVDRILGPLEQEHLGETQNDYMLARVKLLRAKIVPELTETNTPQTRKEHIWTQLADIYIAQQVGSYPEGYLDVPTETRVLETVERFDEDLNDYAKIHRPHHCILEVGEAIEVDSTKPPKNEPDPVMTRLEERLTTMLGKLSEESPRIL